MGAGQAEKGRRKASPQSDPQVAEWQQDCPGPACSFFPAHFTNSTQRFFLPRPPHTPRTPVFAIRLCMADMVGKARGKCPQWAEVQ